ncbi:MAG: DEAD/DEAH box helicase [Flavobacteriales bacterium]
MEPFVRLGLSAPILKAIGKLGFDTPTDIQSQAIPHLLQGDRDFIGLAQTGTGKTAAFGLPLLEQLDPKKSHVQALILAPTRELGQQIAQQIELFSSHLKGIQSVAVYGGANIMTQIHQLRRPCQVVIATPGRLIDLAKRKAVVLDQIEFVILDEADEMLNMGFKDELDTILALTPENKRTWLFSATMPKEIRRLVKQYMDDPFEVRIDPSTAVNADIEHQYAMVRHTDKSEALTRFMDLQADLFGVVFCRTKRDTQDLAEQLMKQGYRADALHGDLSQHQRDRVMRRFKMKDLQVLIATDVAARGIDVHDVTHVFHYSLPNDKAYYTHRAGRTARAGKTGISIAFINRKEKAAINRLSKELGIEFHAVEVPGPEAIAEARLHQWADDVMQMDRGRGIPENLWKEMTKRFGDLSKEELLSRLMSRELAQLKGSGPKDLNLSNATPESKKERIPTHKPSAPNFKKKFNKRSAGGVKKGAGRKKPFIGPMDDLQWGNGVPKKKKSSQKRSPGKPKKKRF